MPFLYHARPPDMRGHVLYPLNRLKTLHPDVYEREAAKYDGREMLLDLHIPILDVRWNDALHLAPIHPALLAASWREVGMSSPAWERDFFAIPVERIDASRAVWFARGALADDDAPLDVERFDPHAYDELPAPPPAHIAELHRRRDHGRRFLAFAYVPHVLVAAPIDVSGLRVVRA